jgi:cell division protein ZapA (FtsZ GTPase activity inhibitor)
MAEHTIKVNIANRPYRLKIRSEKEEEVIRKSVNELDNLVKDYSNNYAYKDYQDLLAMVSLQLANNSLSLRQQIESIDKEMKNQLIEIDEFLSDKLKT